MMTLEQIVILGLACWRLSFLLSHEAGPFDIFVTLRKSLGAREVLPGAWTSDRFLGKLILCPLCLSVWIATGLCIGVMLVPVLWVLVVVLAVTGLSCLAQVYSHR